MRSNGWMRMDREIQKKLRKAEQSGDPEKIKKAHEEAQKDYSTGSGAIIGGIVGSIIFPGLGTWIGAGIGALIGNNAK